MYKIKIHPSSVLGESFDEILVREVQVELHKKANVVWQAINSQTGRSVANGKIELSGDDYDLWGASDEYVDRFILSKMGLEKM